MGEPCNCEENLKNPDDLTDDEWTCPVHGRMTYEFDFIKGELKAAPYNPETD
jgi:hypothetical protein